MQFGIGSGVVHGRGNSLVLQAQDGLDQTGDPGCRIEVADVRLHRTQDARARPFDLGQLESLSQRFDFDRVAQRGAGAVGLNESDGRGVDIGDGLRLGDDLRLTGDSGRGIGHLHRAVVVDRRAADDGVDPVTVLECGLQRFEDQGGNAAAEDGAVGSNVERPAVARRRHHRTRLEGVADVMRNPDGRGAGQRHIAFAGQQALAREVHRDQRRRTGGLHRQARPAQVQFVRHPGGQVVLVVEQDQVEHLDGDALADQFPGVAVRHQVVHQVAAGGAAGENADRSVVAGGVISGVFEGMPGGLQEQPLLRVHHPRGVRGDPEVFGVELVDPVEHGRTADVGGIGERLGTDSGGGECLLGQCGDRLHTATQVVPELGQRVRAGKAAGHSDDRNRVGG